MFTGVFFKVFKVKRGSWFSKCRKTCWKRADGPCFQKICLKYAQFIKAKISLLILYMQTLDHEILRQIEQKAHW